MNFFKTITNLGIQDDTPVYEGTRIRLLNSLTLIGIIFFTGYIVFNIYNGVYKQTIVEIFYITLVSIPTLLLSASHKHFIARNYLSLSSLFLFLAISWFTISSNRDTDAENIMLLYAVVIHFLHNRKRLLFGVIGFSTFIYLKYYKWTLIKTPMDTDQIILFVNYGAIYIGIFWVVGIFISSIENLTENELRIKKDHQLDKEVKALLRSMIDSLPIFTALIDSKGTYIAVNALYGEAFERGVSEIEGHHISEIMAPEITELHQAYFNDAMNGNIAKFESIDNNLHYTGAYIPIFDEENQIKYCSVHAIDIFAIKEAEKKLKISNEAKDRLFAIISHDLRTPISQLQSLLMVAKSADPVEVVKYLSSIEEHFTSLLFTIDNLLNWSRTQLNGFKAQSSSFELTEIVNDTKKLILEKESKKGVLISHKQNKKWKVKADPEHIRIAVRNILSNSIKFSNADDTVQIEYQATDNHVKLSIIDTGIGIDDKVIEALKEGNINTSKKGTAGERGSGMGLTLCEALFKENQCSMTIEKNSDKGTTVSILIPLDQS
ncbi:MAG: ATP-binding protein [Ekhidna sp.]